MFKNLGDNLNSFIEGIQDNIPEKQANLFRGSSTIFNDEHPELKWVKPDLSKVWTFQDADKLFSDKKIRNGFDMLYLKGLSENTKSKNSTLNSSDLDKVYTFLEDLQQAYFILQSISMQQEANDRRSIADSETFFSNDFEKLNEKTHNLADLYNFVFADLEIKISEENTD